MLTDVPDRDHQVVAGLHVDGKQFRVVGDDREAGAVPHHCWRGLQLIDWIESHHIIISFCVEAATTWSPGPRHAAPAEPGVAPGPAHMLRGWG